MGSRHYQYPLRGAATFDPRQSMPAYPPLYPQDDIVVTPVVVPSRRYPHHGHSSSLSRPPTLYGDNARTSNRDVATRGHRSSTLDSTAQRPIIVTTTDRRPHAPSSGGRSGSPVRHEHRYSEASLPVPTSMSRSRSANRAGGYSPIFPPEDFARGLRAADTLLDPGRADTYRSSRPTVVYPSSPRHSTTPLDIEEDYGYTKPSELARYDLEHGRPPNRRRESMEMYTRPNVYYNSSRGLTVETNRTHDPNDARTFDNRGGPPPSTRGFDRLSRYDAPPHVPAPPTLDVPPSPVRERRGSNRLSRPVSLYQEALPRHDEYYRLREDERNQRQIRDLDRESQHRDEDVFHDDGVGTRGFGLRTDTFPAQLDDRRERREQRERARRELEQGLDEPRRRSDESLDRDRDRNGDYDKHDSRRSRQKLGREDGKELRGSKEDDGDYDKHDSRRSRQKPVREDGKEARGSKEDEGEDQPKGFRESMKAGLGVAAAAVGLSGLKDKDTKDDDDKDKRHRREPDDKRDSSDDVEIVSSRAAKSYRSGEKEYIPGSRRERRERKDSPPDDRDVREREREREREEARERHRRAAEARVNGGERGESSKTAARESSESGDEKTGRRRRTHSFNPNDTDSLRDIKDQLAAAQLEKRQTEKEKERKDKDKDKGPVVVVAPPLEARRLSPRQPSPGKRKEEDSRGRDLAPPAHEERQVRLVSPPREKPEPKPIRGILKQPSAKFPEDPNPVREGVAPHKTDEKLKEVPSDARWTKISRKIVNPEALTIGKERFEERDDFVVVLRVLNKDEIQAYAAATATLRERRREAAQREKGREYYGDRDGEKRSSRYHHHYRERDRDDVDDEDDKEERKHRRHKIDDDEEEEDERSRRREHYHKRHRDRDRDRDRDREYAVDD